MSEPVDREQVRRDIEKARGTLGHRMADDLADHCLALLAEIEQAEKERDQAKISEEDEFTKRGSALASLSQTRHALALAESRLAKVPALVETLRRIERNVHGAGAERYAASIARKALAAWEHE